MNNYIATWVYLDSPEERSKYPNTGGDSTSLQFQAVYWRCIVLFYETSLRFHKDIGHLFFTNTVELPVVDGLSIKEFFDKNNIEVVHLKNLYPLPENYFSAFRNQFFEFSIIDYLSTSMSDSDMLILLDSDCVFSKALHPAFETLSKSDSSAMTYVVDYLEDYEIHGVTGKNMKRIFEDLGVPLDKNPYYSGGELLFAKGSFFKFVAQDFKELYKNMLVRHKEKRQKFNEEAHVLSYYYYKLDSIIGGMDNYIKRIWTNRNYYRNVKPEDIEFTIWHLPNEKRVGIDSLYNMIVKGRDFQAMEDQEYLKLIENELLRATNHKINSYKMFKGFLTRMSHRLKNKFS